MRARYAARPMRDRFLSTIPPRTARAALLTLAAGIAAAAAHAAAAESAVDAEEDARWGFHAQATYVRQEKPFFSAAYSGPNSLLPQRERFYSFTTTADLGLRLWEGAQMHVNPEGALGRPLSSLLGAGGISNGELARSAGTSLTVYRARWFIQQRWDAGGERERIDADFNELGGSADARRWTLVAGNFSLLDYFDPNPYAKDPREQFLNWSFLTHGAWDYAADARGYTWGALLEYHTPTWALRAARVAVPVESNGQALDHRFGARRGDQIEIESALPLALSPAGPLRGRLLLFRNRENMGRFADALALDTGTGKAPDVADVRHPQNKTGWGITLEAPLADDAGVFVRASRNDGRSEAYTFTEIDRQLSLGGQIGGGAWGRAGDALGVAFAVNGLSASHRSYLAAGGLGFFLGDGRLRYGREQVQEVYYRWTLPTVRSTTSPSHALQSHISVGAQRIANPGYNRDRGPVRVFAVRWHSEF